MKDVIEAILTRHSVRKFTGEKVDAKDIDMMLRAGIAAPSAVNVQPWSFIVVTDRTILNELCARLPYAKMLDRAGAAILVCGLPAKDDRFAKDFWFLDCSAATENILLAVHGLGYGAVWTAVYPDPQRIAVVRATCKIPENVIPFNVIPVGVPVDPETAPLDKYNPGCVHADVW
jgi:nitroreductase